MNKYSTYAFYRDIFQGKSIEESEFDGIIFKASAILDEITLGRINNITEDISAAACAVADEILRAAQALGASDNGAVASEKTGDESISYNTNLEGVYSSASYRKYYAAAAIFIRDKRLLERWRDA